MEIDWKGHQIAIRQLGSGPAVVLLHGYPLDGAMWSGVARSLSSHLLVVKPDLPGHGANPAAAPGRLEEHADFLEAILENLPSPVGVAGFSMGGYILFALMKRHPQNVRAVALVDTRATGDDEAGKTVRDTTIDMVRSGGAAAILDATISHLLAPASLQNRDLVERVRRIILRQKPETIEADLAAMRDREDSTGSLPEISVPALVLVGEEDVISPPAKCREMADAIPGARLVTIPMAGHLTPMERPKAVAMALSEFLGAALGPSPPG